MTSKRLDLSTCEMWVKCGKIHREDGPALIQKFNNRAYFYLEGRCLNFQEWYNQAGVSLPEKTITMMILKYANK